jgi:exonuclease III
MRLHIISYDMQGFCSSDKATRVRSMLREFKPMVDIFCSQEHKMREGALKMLPYRLWREAEFILAPALDGAYAARNANAISGKGGLLIAVGPSLKPCIADKGILPSGRGIWVTFDHPKMGKFGVINIYAPTGQDSSSERKCLRREIFNTLPNSIPWILLGDFNMIKNNEDQKGGRPHSISGREKRAWEHLLRKFSWKDTCKRDPQKLQFTWDNRREVDGTPDNPKILRRLDRCYAQKQSVVNRIAVISKILAGHCISDHHPVLAIFQDTVERRFSSRYRLNSSILKDESKWKVLKQLVVKELAYLARKNVPPDKRLKLMLIRSTKQTRCWGKSAALKRTLKEQTLREELAAAQLESELNPDDVDMYASWRDKEDAVRKLEEDKARWVTEKSRRFNIQAGKLGHKHVFTSFKALSKQTEIVGLEDEDRTVYDT